MNGVPHNRLAVEAVIPVPEPAKSGLTAQQKRRSFLKLALNGLGALFGIVLGIPALFYLLDPRNRPVRAKGFRTVARLDELPVGRPQQAVVHDVRVDAYTLYPSDVVGRVWLIRTGQKDKQGAEVVTAFSTTCTHLGCSVNFEDNQRQFICPCHGGTFNLDGTKVKGPAPRPLDRLECRVENGLVLVEYQDYKPGEPERIPLA